MAKRNPHGIQERFMDNPYSIIDTANGRWQNRKRKWITMGLQSEVGRDARTFNIKEWMVERDDVQAGIQSDTSIFDPALCELLYTWFAPKEGQVIDPFAGGSVRGIVASHMGLDYYGHELREEQVLANRQQYEDIGGKGTCVWIQGDSAKTLDENHHFPAFDFLLTCPPYGDLEVYSDHPDDISNMSVEKFDEAYADIMDKALAKMKPNTFACIVVGDYRDKYGFLNNFVSKTIDVCQVRGFRLYNEIILKNVVGTLALRIAGQFKRNRKIGKMHQNVLVFYNGNPKKDLKDWHELNLVNERKLSEWL